MLGLRPWVTEVYVNPADFIIGRYDIAEHINVIADERDIVDFAVILFKEVDDIPASNAEHIQLDVNGDKVDFGMEQSHLSDKRAFAAAYLKHNGVIVIKKALPFSAVFLRFGYIKVTNAELGLSPFFLSNSQKISPCYICT